MTANQNPPIRRFGQYAAALIFLGAITPGLAQQPESNVARRLNLHEAVDLALKHNHVVRIATLHVEEEKHAKEIARSAYLPTIRNDSSFGHLTDTEFIAIPGGALGVAGGTAIPPHTFIINQGDLNVIASGTGLTQPLTELFKIKAGNDVAQAELNASREKARGVQNDVALKVRELYYSILVVQSKHEAIEAKGEKNEAEESLQN